MLSTTRPFSYMNKRALPASTSTYRRRSPSSGKRFARSMLIMINFS
jgi:hypothetical protein